MKLHRNLKLTVATVAGLLLLFLFNERGWSMPEGTRTWNWQLMGDERFFSGKPASIIDCGDVQLDISQPFTLEAVFKLSDTTSSHGIVSNMHAYNCGEGISLYFNEGDGRLKFLIGYGINDYEILAGPALNHGQWYQTAVVWDMDNLWMYVNGIRYPRKDDESVDFDIGGDNTTEPLEIGSRYSGSTTDRFQGTIDQVKFTQKAFAQSDVLGHWKWQLRGIDRLFEEDRHIDCGDIPLIADRPYTLEALFKLNDTSPQSIVTYRHPSNSNGFCLGYDGVLYFELGGESGITGSALNSEEWYHVFITWDGSHYKMYINGVLAGSTPSKTAGIFTDCVFKIGRGDHNNPNLDFNGEIDQIEFAQKALLPRDIHREWNWQLINTELITDKVFNGTEIIDCGTVPLDLSSPFTIEALFNISDSSNNCGILSNMASQNGGEGISLYYPMQGMGTRHVRCLLGYGASSSVFIDGPSLNENQWYHIAVTCTGDRLNMFVDGSWVASTEFVYGGDTSSSRLVIGNHLNNSNNNGFKGQIDQVLATQGVKYHDVSLDVSLENPILSNVFEQGIPVSFHATASGNTGDRNLVLWYETRDLWENEVGSGTANIINGSVQDSIDALPLGFLEVTFGILENGYEVAGEKTLSLGIVLPESERELWYTCPWALDTSISTTEANISTEDCLMLVKLAGIPWIRDRMSWRSLEYPGQEYNWSTYNQTAAIAHNLGLKVMQCYHDCPEFYKLTDDRSPNRLPMKDLRGAYNFMKAACENFRDDIPIAAWMHSNEPNGSTFTYETHSADQYAAFVKAAAIGQHDGGMYDGFHRSFKLHGSIYSWTLPYWNLAIENDLMNFVDINGHHQHRGTGKPVPGKMLHSALLQIKRDYGLDTMTQWCTESGLAFPADYESDTNYRLGAAGYLVRAMVTQAARGVDRHFWFINVPHYSRYGEFDWKWGTVDNNGQANPTYFSLAALTYLTREATYLGVLGGTGVHAGDSVKLHVFDTGNETDYTVVCWTDGAEEEIQIELSAEGTLYSLMGNAEMDLIPGDNYITASDIPCYLVVPPEGLSINLIENPIKEYEEWVNKDDEPLYNIVSPRHPAQSVTSFTPIERVIMVAAFSGTQREDCKAHGHYDLERPANPNASLKVPVSVYNLNDDLLNVGFTFSITGDWTVIPPNSLTGLHALDPLCKKEKTWHIKPGPGVVDDEEYRIEIKSTLNGDESYRTVFYIELNCTE